MIPPALRAAIFAATAALVTLAGCSPPSNARVGVAPPDESLFPPAADLMAYRCGSLDCHGNAQRNFVIWSCYGLRLDPTIAPGCRNVGGTNTSPAEYDATFRSLVALEPQVMSDVVQSHGQDLDLLTFVRKARGEESHKGGKLWDAGSPPDDCIGLWLADDPSTTATCKGALAETLDAGTL